MTSPPKRPSTSPLPRIGVFGGTFNPIHRGHLHAAHQVADRLGIERVVFVPAAEPPLKTEDVAPAALRIEWVRIALANEPAFEVDDLELRRAGPSYTVETLRELGRRWAPARLVFFIGCDAFAELGSWRDPGVLLTLSDFAVMTRDEGSSDAGDLLEGLPDAVRGALEIEPDGSAARHRECGTRIERVAIEALPISATEVRERIRAGLPVNELLPEGVEEAVLESGIYAEPADADDLD